MKQNIAIYTEKFKNSGTPFFRSGCG